MRLNGAMQRSLALCLQLSLAFWFGSCSSSQQQQGAEELENSNQEEGEEGAEVTQTDEQSEGEENVAYEENIGEQDDYMAEGDPLVADNTESELQDVIAQMNQEANFGDEAAPADVLNPSVNQVAANAAPAPMANVEPSNIASAAAPAAAAVVGGLPEMNSKMPYIVQKGDTLGKIAKRVYGDQNRWSDIKDLSALNNPNRIYPGDVVYYALTAESLAFAQAYELAPRNEITVQQGQTLANIAAQVYGDSSTWKTIWRQNGHIANPDRLEVGMVVYYIDQAALFASLELTKSTTLASNNNVQQQFSASNFAQNVNMNISAQQLIML